MESCKRIVKALEKLKIKRILNLKSIKYNSITTSITVRGERRKIRLGFIAGKYII